MFERLVRQALGTIPDEYPSAYLENVVIIVKDWPSSEQLGWPSHR